MGKYRVLTGAIFANSYSVIRSMFLLPI